MVDADIRVMTTHEFESVIQASDEPANLLELVYGEMVEKVPTDEHGKLAALIAHFLLSFILPRGIKGHVGVDVRHQIPDDPHNSRLPGVSLRLSDAPPVSSGVVSQMPDLAVEIQSPKDRPHQMRETALYYLQKGARLVWLVYPATQQIEFCILDESGNLAIETVDSNGAVSGCDVLPDFRLSLADLFAS